MKERCDQLKCLRREPVDESPRSWKGNVASYRCRHCGHRWTTLESAAAFDGTRDYGIYYEYDATAK